MGGDSRVYYKKAVLSKFKIFTEKNQYTSHFLNKVANIHPETIILF